MLNESKSPTAAPHPLAPIGFLLQSFLCQGIALGCGVALRRLIETFTPLWGWWTMLILVFTQAIIAWSVARWTKLPVAWQLFNLLVVPGIAALFFFEVPALPFAILVVLAALLYLPTFWTRVPYFPTSVETYAEVARLLPPERDFTAIDLGCGFAPLLRSLARSSPRGQFTGVEISPLAFLGASLGSLLHSNVAIRWRSIWNVDLGKYDVVYAFLAPGPMPELWAKVVREMRPGSIFISNTFAAPAEADAEIPISDKRGARLYVYRR
jgi:hypothetical protein